MSTDCAPSAAAFVQTCPQCGSGCSRPLPGKPRLYMHKSCYNRSIEEHRSNPLSHQAGAAAAARALEAAAAEVEDAPAAVPIPAAPAGSDSHQVSAVSCSFTMSCAS